MAADVVMRLLIYKGFSALPPIRQLLTSVVHTIPLDCYDCYVCVCVTTVDVIICGETDVLSACHVRFECFREINIVI